VPPAEPRGGFRAPSRVRKRREYQAIQGEGVRVSLAHFVLILAARGPAPDSVPRLGITASRKIGGAVVRNRAKRLVREAFRATRALFPADIDVVVIVKRELADLSLSDVIDEWQGAAGLISRRAQLARRNLADKPA
jgi:ribonuclease P protein component